MSLPDLAASVAQLAASRDLSPGEAERAASNLALAGAAPPCHVWYGDPLLSSADAQHSVDSYDAMEAVLGEQQRADWSMFDYAGDLVRREIEGWKARACLCARQESTSGSGRRRSAALECPVAEASCGRLSALPPFLSPANPPAGSGERVAVKAQAAARALPRPAARPLHAHGGGRRGARLPLGPRT